MKTENCSPFRVFRCYSSQYLLFPSYQSTLSNQEVLAMLLSQLFLLAVGSYSVQAGVVPEFSRDLGLNGRILAGFDQYSKFLGNGDSILTLRKTLSLINLQYPGSTTQIANAFHVAQMNDDNPYLTSAHNVSIFNHRIFNRRI